MEGTNMFIGVVYLLCLSRNVYLYPDKCTAVIKDPLERCTNLFSEANLPKDKLQDLRDTNSRTARRMKKCRSTLSTLYSRFSRKRSRRNTERMMLKTNQTIIDELNTQWDRIKELKPPEITTVVPPIAEINTYEPPCNNLYSSLVVDLMPFSYQMIEAISDMFKRCCGDYAVLCPSSTLLQMTQLDKEIIRGSDIVFPVLGRSSKRRMHGYYFSPVYDAPSAYYFTSKQSKESVSNSIAKACGGLWPLLTICLLLAVISGFVAWSIETRANVEEFPRAFHVGLFEGFWWSFISMTTVGYGDKAPKSIAGRVFSIIWILVGITICSMFTASLTTEITKWTTNPTAKMSGKKVGVLKSRLLDSLIVAKQGGVVREVEHDNVSEGIERMADKVNDGSISGFVVDTVTYHYYISLKKTVGRNDVKDKVDDLSRAEVSYHGDKLSFGILFKNKNYKKFFRDYFGENQLYLEACNYFQMNAKLLDLQEKGFLFDPESGMFYTVLYYIIGGLVLILIFGIVYELGRNRLKKKRNIRPQVEEMKDVIE